MWDVIIHNYLLSQNIVVPQLKVTEKERQIIGAYVKDPLVGFHNYVASFDVNSEYPSVIMGSNISPETIIDPSLYTPAMRSLIASDVTVDKLLAKSLDLSFLKDENVCLTANGQFYRRDKQGFMPEIGRAHV